MLIATATAIFSFCRIVMPQRSVQGIKAKHRSITPEYAAPSVYIYHQAAELYSPAEKVLYPTRGPYGQQVPDTVKFHSRSKGMQWIQLNNAVKPMEMLVEISKNHTN